MKRNSPKKKKEDSASPKTAVESDLKAYIQKTTEALRLSEEGFHRITAEVEDYAIILLDVEGVITSWNIGAEKIKGYSSAEIIGKDYKVFYSAEDRQSGLPDMLLERARTLGKANHEGWRVRKNGTRFWGNVTITAIHNDKGEVTAYLKVTRDLTERKIAEDNLKHHTEELKKQGEALKKSEERYHHMIAEVEDYAIILLDPNGIILDWNKGAQKLKGYSADEILGKSFHTFYPKADRESGLPDRLLNEAATKDVARHEGWRVRKDGSLFWGSIVITALHGEGNSIIGFSKVTRDLTERKLADDALKASAEELARKNKILERLNDELSSFAYVASHDLKEPLRKIQTFASRLPQITSLSEKGIEHVEKIRGSAARMQTLIEDLLAYSQISNDFTEFEKIDLNEVLQAVVSDLEIPIQEKNADIEVGDLPRVNGVRFQLHQLFINLLSNSLKFSKIDVSPVIKISSVTNEAPKNFPEGTDPHLQYFHVTVQDNGIGFDPDHASKIFDVFQRLHHKDAFSGTGIGLAIAKKVMLNHGGFILADAQPNQGASFHLYFPIVIKAE